MENEKKQREEKVGEMHKRREKMSDGRHYIIYYSFRKERGEPQKEVKENV